MKAHARVLSEGMAPSESMDSEVRQHIRAWLWHYKESRTQGITNAQLGTLMGYPEATVTNLLNGKRNGGLDTLARMRKRLHMDINEVVDLYPKGWDPENPRTGSKVREE